MATGAINDRALDQITVGTDQVLNPPFLPSDMHVADDRREGLLSKSRGARLRLAPVHPRHAPWAYSSDQRPSDRDIRPRAGAPCSRNEGTLALPGLGDEFLQTGQEPIEARIASRRSSGLADLPSRSDTLRDGAVNRRSVPPETHRVLLRLRGALHLYYADKIAPELFEEEQIRLNAELKAARDTIEEAEAEFTAVLEAQDRIFDMFLSPGDEAPSHYSSLPVPLREGTGADEAPAQPRDVHADPGG